MCSIGNIREITEDSTEALETPTSEETYIHVKKSLMNVNKCVCDISSVFFPRRCVFLDREYLNWGCHSYLFQILETFGQLLTLVEIQGGRCKLHRRFLEDHIVLRWVFHHYCLFTLFLATLGVTSRMEYGRTYRYYDLPLATWFPRKGTHRSNNHRLPMSR